MGIIKGIVHQKMEIVSLFTHFHLISNLYAIIFSEEHAGGGFGGMYHETLQHETTVDLKFFSFFQRVIWTPFMVLFVSFWSSTAPVLLHFYCIKHIEGDLLCPLFKVFILCVWSSRRFSYLIF